MRITPTYGLSRPRADEPNHDRHRIDAPLQVDGLACKVCGTSYLSVPVVHVPVGRLQTDSQVFASDGCPVETLRPRRRLAMGYHRSTACCHWPAAAAELTLVLGVMYACMRRTRAQTGHRRVPVSRRVLPDYVGVAGQDAPVCTERGRLRLMTSWLC